VYLMDVPTRRYRRVEELPTGVISGARWHRDNRHAGLVINSARSPSDVYVLDTANGTVRRWTESELGGIAAGELREPELIRWRSFDGLEITGFHYKPAARFIGRRPVIISIHGGPESQSQPVFLGRNNFLLNELGVAILYPNLRGSRGFGKTFLKLDNGRLREDAVRDIGALLDWIRTQPDLDPERVMVTGGSYGGYMTLAAAVHYNHRIRCALDVVGISNFVTFLENTESYRRDLRRAEYGDERDPEMRAFLQSISPLNHAAKITKPLFIVQGANDPRVPRSEAIQMVETIRRNGGPVWYLEGKDEGHGFRKKANADFQFYATILFVRQYLVDGT
jgi:dipeptidyl aminopeptidase/acylaminoacyl peptidase